jgi:ABC-type antimicrobial peptide transport system permease subunit
VPLKAGRSFSRQFGSDAGKHIVNEAFVKALGLQDPVGKVVEGSNGTRIEIIGVVKNFHYRSLHEAIEPFVFTLEPETATMVLAKLQAGKERETLQKLGQFYKAFNPGFTFNYQFLDDVYQAQYVAEGRVSVLSQYAAGLAVLISCLGLLGLAAFSAERRRKEIGVRKVLGATESGIVYLLTGEFTRLVGGAVVVGLPLGFFIARQWLSAFAYRVDLEAWYFAAAGLLALLVALLTVGSQALRAARINPVQCLKEE